MNFFWFFLSFSILDQTDSCHSFKSQADSYYPRARARGITSMDRFDQNIIDLDYSNELKCATSPPYSSNDIRGLSSLTPFFEQPILKVEDGGKITCSFDDQMEFCGWHNAADTLIKFWKTKFDQNFDMDRFDCTNIRRFPIDGNFLLAGGEPSLMNQKAAIETEIPCQYGEGEIQFDFWANTANPIVRFCIISLNGADIICEDLLPMPNPANFTIPTTAEPIRIRIEVVNLSSEDVVLIDNLYFSGQICEIVEEETTTPTAQTNFPQLITGVPEKSVDAFFDEHAEEVTISSSTAAPSVFGIRRTKAFESFSTPSTSSHLQFNELSPCSALTCTFNDADSCFYGLSGTGATSSWKLSDSLVGNRHTGIQRINLDDQKQVGFVYVGSDSESHLNDVFVMESPIFTLSTPTNLVFDIYLRSFFPRLKVCIDNFEDCPYNSVELNVDQFWFFSQKVPLREGARKVFFVAQNVAKHQFLAIDNIHLETEEGTSFC